MFDIHSHILHDVDDGASSVEEAVKMACEAEKTGIKKIIATPHYRKGVYESKDVLSKYYELKSRLKDMNIELRLGSEIYLSPDMPLVMDENSVFTLNRSGYILIEVPFNVFPVYLYEAIYRLQLRNYRIIIAHPERVQYFCRDIKLLATFIETGCKLQIDAASILGIYGRKIRRFAKKLIKSGFAHYVASDAHCAKDYKERYQKAYRKVKRWTGEACTKRLFVSNPQALAEDSEEKIYGIV